MIDRRSQNRTFKTPLTAVAVAILLAVFATVSSAAVQIAAGPAQNKEWPSIEKMLATGRVAPGTALETFIRDNQDFDAYLDPSEADDAIGVPLWLRVAWRQAHPESRCSPNDPTGGYPRALLDVATWMIAHQDLKAAEVGSKFVQQPMTAIGSNVRVSNSAFAPRSESDIRIDFWHPNRIIAASNDIEASGRQAQYYSADSGATWGKTTLSLQGGEDHQSDPSVDWTSDGGAWASTLGVVSLPLTLKFQEHRSTNGGATWFFDGTVSGSQTAADKEMMWVDHSASSPFSNYIYAIWHNNAPAYMNRRNGPSGAWGSPIRVSGAETAGTAIGGDVKTNAYGDVFGFWPDTGYLRIWMVKSVNGGTSYGTPTLIATTLGQFQIGIPADNSRRALIYVSAGAYRTPTTNIVYATWTDLIGASECPSGAPGDDTSSTCKTRVWFTRSTDGGATWETKRMINNQATLNDQFGQAMSVDEATGRISVIYYDTVADSGRKKTDVWYQTSSDFGVTWSIALKITTAMTDETVAGADFGNQYGDYNGLSGYNGQIAPSWTDRRNGGHEEIWTASVTEPPCAPLAAPTGLTATAIGVGRIDLSWSAVSGAFEYRTYRSTTSGGPYALLRVLQAPSSTFSDTGMAGGVTYYYVVRSFAGCESANSNEASATSLCPTCRFASSEQLQLGTKSGDYTATFASDDVRESLTTVGTKQHQRVENRWTFTNVAAATSHILHIEGDRTFSVHQPDDFQFSYSTNGTNFTDIPGALINSSTEIPGGTDYGFGPSGLSGTVVIRVVNTAQLNSNPSTVRIDHLYIRNNP